MERGWSADGGETDLKVSSEPETLNLGTMRKRVRNRDKKRECVREKRLLKLKLKNILP